MSCAQLQHECRIKFQHSLQSRPLPELMWTQPCCQAVSIVFSSTETIWYYASFLPYSSISSYSTEPPSYHKHHSTQPYHSIPGKLNSAPNTPTLPTRVPSKNGLTLAIHAVLLQVFLISILLVARFSARRARTADLILACVVSIMKGRLWRME